MGYSEHAPVYHGMVASAKVELGFPTRRSNALTLVAGLNATPLLGWQEGTPDVDTP